MDDSPLKKKSREDSSDLEEFDKVFTQLISDLDQFNYKFPEISDAAKWFRKVCEYNVPHGKKNRGLTVVHSYRFLAGDQVKDQELKLARVIGWCIEWLQAYFLVADDIMDQSVTRRGQPCWYKKDNKNLIAINDSFYLDTALYEILRKYIRDQPYYMNIVELFHRTTYQTVVGQNLDLITAPQDHVDFSQFTMDRYSAIVKWKTAFYSFYLPVAAAMYMVGITDEEQHKNAETILLQMGHFFQVQDDYLDCYGDPAVTGKIGTDIEDNKCSWLVVQALSRCNQEQRQILQDNYAQHDPDKVNKVKAVFSDLNLTEVYSEYEETSYQELLKLIDKLSGKMPKQMFTAFADKIYKRKK